MMMKFLFAFLLNLITVEASTRLTSPLHLTADLMQYDIKKKKIIAKGSVHLTQKNRYGQERFLLCDELIYDQSTGMINARSLADGCVHFQDVTGDIFESKTISFQDTFQEGSITSVIVKRTDHSTLKGDHFITHQGKSVCQNAQYTACKICKDEDPLWQVKAEQVSHDLANKTIEYQHAWIEVKGIPVFYFPYFSHPDPKVKRKSGFLSPVFGQNTDLGYAIGIPFYYVVNDQQDLTITPTLLTKELGVLSSEYRNRFQDGFLILNGSYTKTQQLSFIVAQPQKVESVEVTPKMPTSNRWYYNIKGQYDYSDTQRVMVNLQRASDMTYLSRYTLTRQVPFVNHNTNLRSTVVWQRFTAKSFAALQAFSFQTDAPDITPLILPKASYMYQEEMPLLGGFWRYDADLLTMFRRQNVVGRSGTKMYRLSNGMTWQRPVVLPFGQLVTATASSRIDFYTMQRYFDNQEDAVTDKANGNHHHMRFFPQGSFDWKWPWHNRLDDHMRWIVSPRVMVVSSPLTINNRHIPNEDCHTFELDDISLFMPNRFDGLDRVDAGSRIIVGIDNTLRFSQRRHIHLFLGQSKRLDHQHVVQPGKGEDISSDLIAKLDIKPHALFQTRHRIAYSPTFQTMRYAENGAMVGGSKFKLELAHVFLNRHATPGERYVSQMNIQISSKISDRWFVSAGQIRNLNQSFDTASLATFISATYDNECFTCDIGMYKTSQYDRDIKPETSFLIRFNFKTLSAFTFSDAPRYPQSPLTYGIG